MEHNKNKSVSGVAAVALILGAAGPATAGPNFSEWGDTTAIGVGGGCPIESRDGNKLYVARGPSGFNSLEIWVSERPGRAGEFGTAVKLDPPLNDPDYADFCPTPLTGGWLMFVSNRPGSCGGSPDMYIARYQPGKGWSTPENLGCAPDGPNTDGTELAPSLVTNSEGTYVYYSSNIGGDQDIYRSRMEANGTFGPGVAITELNTASADQQPNVSRNGLEMVFSSNRPGASGQDVFTASRASVNEPWGNVRNLTSDLGLPTVDGSETRASLSWDGKRLYYGSAGTIFVSTRKPGK